MLLEYDVDTKDEKMVPRAIELRKRVAGRKIAALASAGVVDEDTLLVLKTKNREQRSEHASEDLDISRLGLKERISIARSQHQFVVEGQLRHLQKDVSRAARLGKAKIDALSDLEKRIQSMRAQLREPGEVPIEQELGQALNESTRGALEKQYANCKYCDKRVLLVLIANHERMCPAGKELAAASGVVEKSLVVVPTPVYNINQDIVTAIATFPPQPPRHCKVVNFGCSFIEWYWQPPIIDGGLDVYEYELSFSLNIMEFDKEVMRFKKWTEHVPSYLTTEWACENPIAHNGCRMTNLRASTEYYNFKIRCCNLRGWSDWVDMLPTSQATGSKKPSVTTLPADQPSAPLFLKAEDVTSSTCMSISWDPPFYDGGSEITHYTIHYTVLEIAITVTSRNVTVEHPRTIEVDGSVTSITIRNLLPDSEIVRIGVCATNKEEQTGPRIELTGKECWHQIHAALAIKRDEENQLIDPGAKPVYVQGIKGVYKTLPASQYTKLQRELTRATDSTSKFIDSDFFTGIRQRYLRVEYLLMIHEEIKVTDPDPKELEEAKEWEAVKQQVVEDRQRKEEIKRKQEEEKKKADDEWGQDDDETNTTVNEFVFTLRQRRRHFKIKIQSMAGRLAKYEEERANIDKKRLHNTYMLKLKEKRQMTLRLEAERLKQYHGATISSAALHGAEMNYETSDYRTRIDKAYNQTTQEIADLKYQVMAGENRRQLVRKYLVQCEEERKERMAAFLEFDQNYHKNLLAIERLNAAMGGGGDSIAQQRRLVSKCFAGLVAHMRERQGERDRVTNLFLKVLVRKKHNAFEKWASGTDFSSGVAFKVNQNAVVSVGGALLKQASTKRVQLQGELRDTVTAIASIRQSLVSAAMSKEVRTKITAVPEFKLSEEGLDPQKVVGRGMIYLYEGDGYARELKYKQAQFMYEAQILWLRARPRLDIKMLAMCHGRLGKMFLLTGKKNRAIVEFDRQLSLAREIKDRVEEAEAFYGLGEGYLLCYDYDNSLRYLGIALARYEALQNVPKYCGALRSMRECYDRIGKYDQVRSFNQQIEKVEGTLVRQILNAHTHLDDMKSRLVSTTADIENVVKIERTTYRALQLKKEAAKRNADIAEYEEQYALQEEECEEVLKMLDAIGKEMNEALETDELEMMSYLVHDQPQIIEIEELKTRLKERQAAEVIRLKEEQSKLKGIGVHIKNATDDVDRCDQLLEVEEGALMRHTRTDKPFRCIALCGANAAGDEVTGTATGGFEEFVAAEGSHVHIIDYHSGELQNVFLGSSGAGHAGAAGAGGSEDNNGEEVASSAAGSAADGMPKEEKGHGGVVTCLLHDGAIIFSGSTDETIISWHLQSRKKQLVFRGHEGSITCLAAEELLLMSGSADATVRLWNKFLGDQLRVVHGHAKSVLSAELGSSWMLTGSADTEVLVWKVHKKARKKHMSATVHKEKTMEENLHSAHANVGLTVECEHRLQGHEVPVTCVRYGRLEVLSGDVLGRIFIWWMATGEILRKCNVHKGPIKCMQFDVVHIVSGGVDGRICITDIANGEVLQSLRGHTAPVIAVAFDHERILSASGDNTLRYWAWGKKSAPKDKVHVLDQGETLAAVGKRYAVSIANIMKWNGIVDSKHVHSGMKLIVRKGDPTALTDAERFAVETERKRLATMELTSKQMAKQNKATHATGGRADAKFNRVHQLATDIDFVSLGNRMFGREKRKLELFPDGQNPNANPNSLGSRFDKGVKEGLVSGLGGAANKQALIEAGLPAYKTGKAARVRFFITDENQDEWGDISDALALTMLSMFVEYEAYSVVLEQKRMLRSKYSLIGRINQYYMREDAIKKESEEKRLAALEEEGAEDEHYSEDDELFASGGSAGAEGEVGGGGSAGATAGGGGGGVALLTHDDRTLAAVTDDPATAAELFSNNLTAVSANAIVTLSNTSGGSAPLSSIMEEAAAGHERLSPTKDDDRHHHHKLHHQLDKKSKGSSANEADADAADGMAPPPPPFVGDAAATEVPIVNVRPQPIPTPTSAAGGGGGEVEEEKQNRSDDNKDKKDKKKKDKKDKKGKSALSGDESDTSAAPGAASDSVPDHSDRPKSKTKDKKDKKKKDKKDKKGKSALSGDESDTSAAPGAASDSVPDNSDRPKSKTKDKKDKKKKGKKDKKGKSALSGDESDTSAAPGAAFDSVPDNSDRPKSKTKDKQMFPNLENSTASTKGPSLAPTSNNAKNAPVGTGTSTSSSRPDSSSSAPDNQQSAAGAVAAGGGVVQLPAIPGIRKK